MEAKRRAIYFYQYLPPWRIDVFNAMGEMYDLTIVFTNADCEGFTYNRGELLSKLRGIKTVFLNNGFKIGGRPIRFGIYKLLKDIKPVVVFSHEYSPTSILVALYKQLGILDYKYYLTTSDNVDMAEASAGLKAKSRDYVLKHSDGVVVYSNAVKDWYKRRYPRLYVGVCPNIQDPDTLLAYRELFPPIIEKYHKAFGLDGCKVALYTGRLVEVKGLDLMLNAFAKSNNGGWKLVIVGNGEKEQELKAQAKKLGIDARVVFAGFHTGAELYAWYDMANFFILPSRYEPFGAVVNEALVYGCPVVASKYIGAADFITEANGMLFDPLNEEEFTNTLNKAFEKFAFSSPHQREFNALCIRGLRKCIQSKGKQRLLIFHPYLAPYRVDLYNHFANEFNLRVSLFGSDKEIQTLGYNLEDVNRRANFNFEYYQHGIYLGRHLLSSIYLKLIKRFHPNIVIAHELGLNTLVAICLKHIFGFKLFTTIDDSPEMAKAVHGIREELRKFVMAHVDGAISVNPKVTTLLNEKYGSGELKSLFFPIIQDDKVLAAKINDAYKRSKDYVRNYDLSNKKVVLFVGRLEKMKNPTWLAEQFIEIDDSEAVLVIVGEGREHEKLNKMVECDAMRKRIIVTGALSGEDLYAWYYLAHLFVLPSSFEPFGAVVNEALVAGCRTIVSDKVGANSLISESNGSIFKSGDAEDLKRCLRKELNGVGLHKKQTSLMPKPFIEYYRNLIEYITK